MRIFVKNDMNKLSNAPDFTPLGAFFNVYRFQLTSEKENIVLTAEINRLKSEMKEMIGHFENDMKMREVEKTRLNNKIEQLKEERIEGDKKYVELMAELEDMRSKLLEMKRGFKEEIEQRQK